MYSQKYKQYHYAPVPYESLHCWRRRSDSNFIVANQQRAD